MRTYQQLIQNERRAVELSIDDQDGNTFTPSAAYAQVNDSNGTVVTVEAPAFIDGTTSAVYTIVGTAVTANVGEYMIVWRLKKEGYTYYHATDLEVVQV